ncbi:aminopeptidase N [Wohlfahrtiimonas chitiniclastica]|uniref:aminopeptidase N n=1 Tax=Wohlfahrtiimonas chitiniclastica TaxID=400946 RepID=UPI000B98EDD3|nr:aminopeptidase N [Wohlfahrtiimonas chitiniclastica]OYQ79896.1 aminopeptidase N [Wohlfahrtiimonas chitiniclastica]
MPVLKKVLRQDYQAPDFTVSDVALTFELKPVDTLVTTTLTLQKNPATAGRTVILNGTPTSELIALSINGTALNIHELTIMDDNIHLTDLMDDAITITLSNRLKPANNTALEGLYLSNGIFCTDCEPEGFRNITYFPDRPDIMAKYTVTIIADQEKYPVLLSNGNLIEAKTLDNGLHQAIWHDPFPKPSYLFALVAGDLGFIEDQHMRPNGTPVQLRIYAAHNELEQCHYALGALKRAMEWDEKRFDLVCDVDQYNIVAIHDFNGGAMENKGLNIFNAKYVLANSEIATDADFETIESIIGHEYFHNWTGNRVTCRDWFQLSLKEGLTVFRDQEFTADLRHRGLKRIDDVKMLRNYQFPEDAGPLKHPIRPESYVEMRNFYTTTVYEKGAEVVRLYQTLLGQEGFKRGLNHYLDRFDGTAATCDDFLQSMAEANNADLSGLEHWYSQAGTPQLHVTKTVNDHGITLHFKQYLSAEGENLKPQLIPINFALISKEGDMLHEDLFILNAWEDECFIPCEDQTAAVSLLRDFSAPVLLNYDYSTDELLTIAYYDTDDFARWEAAQRYIANIIGNPDLTLEEKQQRFSDPLAYLLTLCKTAPNFYALFLTPPHAEFIQRTSREKNLHKIWTDLEAVMTHAAKRYEKEWLAIYENMAIGNTAARDLKNCVLAYLAKLPQHELTVTRQYEAATNMTDRMAALRAAVMNNHSTQETLLNLFLEQFKHYPSVVDKWFSLQASSPYIALDQLNLLRAHPAFNMHNPNRVRSLFSAFGQNKVALYQQPSVFYPWLLENIVMIDKINPQVAARLATPFSQLDFLPKADKNDVHSLVNSHLSDSLSKNLAEQLSRSL